MYDHLQEYYLSDTWSEHEKRVAEADAFLDYYTEIRAQDVYRWLWEGEFGGGASAPELTLDRISFDLRIARTNPRVYEQKIWEPVGLSMRILKINIVPYADGGCPLLRLLELARRTGELRPNTLRFKRNWYFLKTQIVPGMHISVDDLNAYENTIAFHMTPEVSWSTEFMETYGTGYRLVPRSLFFRYFPEYEPVDDERFRLPLEEEGESS